MFAHPFYFVRHGVTNHNQSQLVMGQTDVPLNADGRRQARHAVLRLRECGIRSIFASPLSRALETATILGDALGLPVTEVLDLRERNWGIYEGRNRSERPHTADPEGGETLEIFTHRTLEAIRHLPGPFPYLLVAHNGTCRVLRRHFGLHTVEDMVPNGIPVCFSNLPPGSGWREYPLGIGPK
ncbi:MAG: histidine phosphatase family protein [Alphaproteobacteria bacterium]|nr:histidine phosphatase family protein [Alphaproteobacteria bacterium]